ncbi:IS66 family insertion sequence element accessory protein TnpA [Paenibacillus sedimenti]|uniref:IS66 family insertion sequence element accessory protein TnpB n=1 Tax=Paenibacillus sedimenti TaxID=2770274 RepID=A0A926KQC4_9BACL|nr:IS66 family insertion sequence element accessory protein TnpB [Paenibacillus sedimenti]MBD0380991.1 IS66 family insertion sequence element accessory protein TnpB [Paenibacillus sedimenti]
MNPSYTEGWIQMDETLQAIWAKRIAAYQESGQTLKAWCAEQNVTLHQLKYWLYKAPKTPNRNTSTTFRAVNVMPTTSEDNLLWVQVGPARIAVRPGFKPELLRDIVAALGTEC